MNSVDFLPEQIRITRARRRTLTRQGYLLAVCAMALVAMGYLRDERVIDTQAELGLIEERAASVNLQLSQRKGLERERAEFLIFRRVEEQLGSRTNTLHLLAEIERLLPDGVILTSLRVETVEMPVKIKPATAGGRAILARSGAPGDGGHIMVKRLHLNLTGLAPEDVKVATFIGHLSASKMLEGVNMGYVKGKEIKSGTKYGTIVAREFQVSCYVVR